MDRDLKGDVGAQARPTDDRFGDVEVVEKGYDLSAEQIHRVVAGVCGLIALSVPEEIDKDDAVAALGKSICKWVVMGPRKEKTVDQDERSLSGSLPSPTLFERDLESVVAERGHRSSLRPAC